MPCAFAPVGIRAAVPASISDAAELRACKPAGDLKRHCWFRPLAALSARIQFRSLCPVFPGNQPRQGRLCLCGVVDRGAISPISPYSGCMPVATRQRQSEGVVTRNAEAPGICSAAHCNLLPNSGELVVEARNLRRRFTPAPYSGLVRLGFAWLQRRPAFFRRLLMPLT